MTQRTFAVLLAVMLGGCATSKPPAMLPVQPQLVPSPLSAAHALQRVTELVQAHGFTHAHDVLASDGQASSPSIAWASGKLVSDDGQRCSGAIEVVQASTRQLPGEQPMLGLSCHSERLVADESTRKCRVVREAGCAEAGDQIVARLALDAVGL